MTTPTDEFLFFDVVIHGMFFLIDGYYAALVTFNRPQPAVNDEVFGPEEAA